MLESGLSLADSWQHAWLSKFSTEYDTNPAMSPTNPGGVWRALFEPSYALTGKTGENDLKAGLALQLRHSSNKRLDPNRDSPAAFFDWLHHSGTSEFGVSSKYSEMATRDSRVDAVGLVPAASTRTSRYVSGLWRNRFTERSTLVADGSYEGVSYQGASYQTVSPQSANFVDYSMRSGGLRFSYALNELITPFVRVYGNRYVPANGGPSIGLADTTLGLDWITEYTDWTMQVGKARIAGVDAIFEGAVGARYNGQRTHLAVNAGRMVSPSGLGGFVKADQVSVGWRYALSEYDNAGIDLEGRKNLFIAINNPSSSSTTLGAWTDHALTPLWKMRAYCLHLISRIVGSESVSSNLVGVSFVYNSANP